ncbi:MAG: hypothetical protein AAFQ43_02105, partial [Bacteroidota bacterium]
CKGYRTPTARYAVHYSGEDGVARATVTPRASGARGHLPLAFAGTCPTLGRRLRRPRPLAASLFRTPPRVRALRGQ